MSLPPPLPAALRAGGEDHRLHPWSWLFVLLMQLRHYFLPLVALLVFGQRGDHDPMWAQLICRRSPRWSWSRLQYLSYRYRIGSDAITVRSGLLCAQRRRFFARIHNVEVAESAAPAVRRGRAAPGVGRRRAPSGNAVLKLDQALALERLVRQRGRAPQATDAVPAPAVTVADSEHVLLRLSSWDVMRMGLLSNRGWALAVCRLRRAVPDRAAAGDGRSHPTWWPRGFRLRQPPAPRRGRRFPAAVPLLLGWLALRVLSVVLTLLRYHGFTLSEQDRRLTVSAGLLQPPAAVSRVAASRPGRCAKPPIAGSACASCASTAPVALRDEDRALRELAPLAQRRAASSWCSTCCLSCSGSRRNGTPCRSVAGGGCAWERCCWYLLAAAALRWGPGPAGAGVAAGGAAGRSSADGTHGLAPGRALRGGSAWRLVEALVALGRTGQGAGPAPAALAAGQAVGHQQPAAGYCRRAWRCGIDPAPSAAQAQAQQVMDQLAAALARRKPGR